MAATISVYAALVHEYSILCIGMNRIAILKLRERVLYKPIWLCLHVRSDEHTVCSPSLYYMCVSVYKASAIKYTEHKQYDLWWGKSLIKRKKITSVLKFLLFKINGKCSKILRWCNWNFIPRWKCVCVCNKLFEHIRCY